MYFCLTARRWLVLFPGASDCLSVWNSNIFTVCAWVFSRYSWIRLRHWFFEIIRLFSLNYLWNHDKSTNIEHLRNCTVHEDITFWKLSIIFKKKISQKWKNAFPFTTPSKDSVSWRKKQRIALGKHWRRNLISQLCGVPLSRILYRTTSGWESFKRSTEPWLTMH